MLIFYLKFKLSQFLSILIDWKMCWTAAIWMLKNEHCINWLLYRIGPWAQTNFGKTHVVGRHFCIDLILDFTQYLFKSGTSANTTTLGSYLANPPFIISNGSAFIQHILPETQSKIMNVTISITQGGSPDLVVMGKDSRSKGHGLKSRHGILDGHFFTYTYLL